MPASRLDYDDVTPPIIPNLPHAIDQSGLVDEARREIDAIFDDAHDSDASTGIMIDMNEAATWDMTTAREHLGTEFDYSVEVDGKTMNVNVQGRGERYVVILPGRGVTAPSCDFAPLTAQLKDTCRVVTIEPFGSGLSDMTDKPRTSEQLTNEYHEALAKLGINHYVLVAHSISGIHGLHYANKFANEVNAFVGIDTATPKMDQFITPELMEATSVSDDAPHTIEDDIRDVEGYAYSPEEMIRMRILHTLNSKNDDIFQSIRKQQGEQRTEKPYDTMQFPPTISTKFFLSTESVGLAPEWYEREHVKQLTQAEGSEVQVLSGGHFLHHNQASTIAVAIKAVA